MKSSRWGGELVEVEREGGRREEGRRNLSGEGARREDD